MKTKTSEDGIANFITELATYYMEFLETDFHKRQVPKRSVKFHNSKNLRVGLNLAKYNTFQSSALKAISAGKSGSLNISQEQHRAFISQNIQNQIITCSRNLCSDEVLNEVAEHIATSIAKLAVDKTIDKRLSGSVACATEAIRSKIVTPFSKSIDKLLQNRAGAEIESIYNMEENLVEILSDPLDELISEWVTNEQSENILYQLKEVLNGTITRNSIKEYFNDFSVHDLFFEIKELVDNNLILDKQDIYFYFCDIQFQKDKYPLFYVPLTITKQQENSFRLDFDPVVYINKKAVEFIIQKYNAERDQQGIIKSISERIIYPGTLPESMPEILSGILTDVINFFHLQPNIDFEDPTHQEAKGLFATVSNSMYICIFDKSDEAMVNDYEEILKLIKSQDTELISNFTHLIGDFLTTNPKSYKDKIEDEWENQDSAQKLVFRSPIPLNPEQRKILHALDKKDCKYITVEGPPGTGKSHTITAIVFQAILHNQSVLMLSDKKEALDVIEDKITDVMNRVRISDDFQNPILRIGKTGNTYGQILSAPSINKIGQHFRAVKHNQGQLEASIANQGNDLTEKITTTINNYEDVKIADIEALEHLDNKYAGGARYPIDFDEELKSKDKINHIGDVWQSMEKLDSTLHYGINNLTLLDMFQSICNDRQECATFSLFLAFAKGIQELRTTYQDRSFLKIFDTVTGEHVKALNAMIEQYREIGSGIFGYLFKGKEIAQLSHKLNAVLSCNTPIALREDAEAIERASSFFGDANSMLRQYNLSSFLADPLPVIYTAMLPDNHVLDDIDLDALTECLKTMLMYARAYPLSAEKIGLTLSNMSSCFENDLRRLSENVLDDMLSHLSIQRQLSHAFDAIPLFDYAGGMSSYQKLLTEQMTHLLDGRLLDFYNNARNTATTLRGIIKKKQRFPKDDFDKLKEAFPCIVAGIRDYAEYIPLESGLFDIVIIDEASQVSIAQAFPALLRAKKVVVLGDKKQFSNVKTAHAGSDKNNQHLNSLDRNFRDNVSKQPAQIARLSKFDIKTSILEFFDSITNFDIMLTKHFRGYRELISYSSKYFYDYGLQAIRIRGKAIEDTIKFTFIKHDGKQDLTIKHNGKQDLAQNTNSLECEFILGQLCQMKAEESGYSVGIITPHTNQQKLIASAISSDSDRDYFYDKLNLKVMTFDTCQGEERDIIFYSMVASSVEDKLWGVFIKDDPRKVPDSQIKAQRLNVGFSRAKECMHFVLSKPIEEFKGAIGQALLHYSIILRDAHLLPDTTDVDTKSPMETKVLEWIKNTAFFQNHADCIELKAQFPIGKYLKELDKSYDHPAYRVDFLLLYRNVESHQYRIIIEYDGFNESFGHFTQNAGVNASNYDHYYTAEHVEREKVIEGYGYTFLRINRFNLGKDPVSTLHKRLLSLTQPSPNPPVVMEVQQIIRDLANGHKKECPKCSQMKDIDDFKDSRLVTGMGRICKKCKANNHNPNPALRTQPTATTENKCPRCDSTMVRKTGRYGAFYGCSTYPKCHGTRNIR